MKGRLKWFSLRSGVLLALVAGGLFVASPAAADVDTVSCEATALEAEGVIDAGPFAQVGPVVAAPPGNCDTAPVSVVDADVVGDVGILELDVAADTLTADANSADVPGPNGTVTSTAGVQTLDLDVDSLGSALDVAVVATGVTSTCTSGPSGSTGTSNIATGSIVIPGPDISISGTAAPNTTFNIGAATIVLNEQTASTVPGFSEITVTAIHVTLFPGTALEEDIYVARVHCDVSGSSILAATFAGITARRVAKGALVRWRTSAEVDVLGFNVFRQVGQRRVRVNRRLIAASAGIAGGSYSYLDRRAPKRKAARYWVQTVDLDGSRSWYGPARVSRVSGR